MFLLSNEVINLSLYNILEINFFKCFVIFFSYLHQKQLKYYENFFTPNKSATRFQIAWFKKGFKIKDKQIWMNFFLYKSKSDFCVKNGLYYSCFGPLCVRGLVLFFFWPIVCERACIILPTPRWYTHYWLLYTTLKFRICLVINLLA